MHVITLSVLLCYRALLSFSFIFPLLLLMAFCQMSILTLIILLQIIFLLSSYFQSYLLSRDRNIYNRIGVSFHISFFLDSCCTGPPCALYIITLYCLFA